MNENLTGFILLRTRTRVIYCENSWHFQFQDGHWISGPPQWL